MAKSANKKDNPSDSSISQPESDLDDTKPRRIAPQPTDTEAAAGQDLSVTRQTPSIPFELQANKPTQTDPAAAPKAAAGAETFEAIDQTRPTPIDDETDDSAIPRGFEHTIPPPSWAALSPVGSNDHAESETGLQPGSPPLQLNIPVKETRKKRKGSAKPKRQTARRSAWSWVLIAVLGLAAMMLIAGIGAAGGYASGIDLRRSAERTQVVQAADQQFHLGLQDLAAGSYDRARQRFEYVIQMNPNYPGATEKLAEVLLYLNATATPTVAALPTTAATADPRPNEDLFSQANQAILNSEWDAAVEALLALRQKDINYRTVEIDGMLFLALRNRGKNKIISANLESGIYDLTLASKFGPLDSEASGLLNWSQLYITGASFWEIDWAQVVNYFSEVAPSMPNLMDSSGMTASERYRQALYNYGNQLAQGGQFCQAVERYAQSLQIAQNAEVQAAWEQAVKGCEGGGGGGGGQETPKPGKKKTATAEAPPPGP